VISSSVQELTLLALASVWVLLLPGVSILARLPRLSRPEFSWIYAIALGLAVNPLLFLLLALLRIPVNRLTLLCVGIAFLTLLVLRILNWIYHHGLPSMKWLRIRLFPPAGVLFFLLFVAAFFVRWIPLMPMQVLPGVDSNQHAVISALFLANGGIPTNYLPYFPLSSFTYHFGVHADAAALAIVTGLPVHRVLIFLEPFLIALAALTTAVLAHALTKNVYHSFGAAALVAFVTAFPAWYLNWARLPQIAAVVLLPLVLAELALISAQDRFRRTAVLSLLAAGLILTHYRIAIVLAYGVVSWFLWRLFASRSWHRMVAECARASWAFILAVVLALPWLARLASSFRFGSALSSPLADVLPPAYYYSYERIRYINSVPTNIWFLTLLAFGLVVAIIKKRDELIFLLTWVALQLVFSNPYLLPLPWSGLVDFATVVSILFVPLAILASYAVSLPAFIKRSVRVRVIYRTPDGRFLYRMIVMAIIIIGALQTFNVVRVASVYFYPEDVEAFEWISSRVPRDATFLTPMYVSGEGLVQALDAGAWISYFTGRQQVGPPLIYRSEQSFSGNYEDELRELVTLWREIQSRQSFSKLVSLGITHIYVGKKSAQSASVSKIEGRPWYRLIYEKDGVRIYELDLSV
jgi:hypothetical protein